MDSSWWAVVVAVIAAGVAAWQAVEARRARIGSQTASKDAESHEQAALKAAQDAVGAAEDSASSLGRIASAVESQSEKDTWRKAKKTATLWRVRNVSGHEVQFVSFETDDERLQVVGDTGDGFDAIGPRSHFDVLFEWRIGEKNYASLQVFWLSADNDRKRMTLTFDARPPAQIYAG